MYTQRHREYQQCVRHSGHFGKAGTFQSGSLLGSVTVTVPGIGVQISCANADAGAGAHHIERGTIGQMEV